jgi:hypothetical protein
MPHMATDPWGMKTYRLICLDGSEVYFESDSYPTKNEVDKLNLIHCPYQGSAAVEVIGSASWFDPWGAAPAGWLWGSGGGPPPIDQLPGGGGGSGQGQNAQAKNSKREDDCPPNLMPKAFGFTSGANAEFSIGAPFGAAYSMGTGYYWPGNNQMALVGAVGATHLGDAQANNNWGFGGGAISGVGFAITNANAPSQLAGPSRVTNISILHFQVQISRSSKGIWGFSIGAGLGFGGGVSSYVQKNTIAGCSD